MRDAAGVAACGMARLHLVRGRYRDAARWLAEAEIHLLGHDPFGAMVLVRCTAVGIACFTGDFDGTLTAHERLEAWIAQRPPLTAQRVAVARAAAWAQWVRSPAVGGQSLLDDADLFAGGLPGLAPALAYDALRSGHPGAPAVVASLADRCRSRIVAAFAAHGAARATRDGAALLLAAEEMAAIGALRYAVEAASEAATVFVGQGRSDSARRAAARARGLHAPDQGASLPVIDGLDATAVELTPRQTQLVELARKGLSNAEIADRLVISIRTVETHLYRGMHKLGVGDRHDL
jgi:DNA-binding NarL/FixJ family response regulator